MPLDPSEMDRIVSLTGLPLARLVDWKNRAAEAFEMRIRPVESGMYSIEVNTPERLVIGAAVPVVHGEYDTRKEDGGSIVYTSKPGNSMGQLAANDGRPAYGVAYDVTSMDAEGRPLFKVYFGSATQWFVKNVYHAKWNELRDVRRELEPDAAPPPPTDDRVGKERGRNPRDAMRAQEAQQRGEAGERRRRGGRGRRGGGGGGGGGPPQRGQGGGGGAAGGEGGERRRRGRRGGRGRGGGGGGGQGEG